MTILLWPEGAPLAQGAADEDQPALFPYLLEGGNRPVVIVAPGGGYMMRANYEGGPVAEWLNSIGISAFVLRYRVAPYRYPCALLDAQRAIRTVRTRAAEFGVDPARIGILGFSAGGHLAASTAAVFDGGEPDAADPVERASSRPDLSVLCYPVITMDTEHVHSGCRDNLFGAELPDPSLIQATSIEQLVTSDTAPAFIWHTADDQAVPVEHSLLYASALSQHNVPFDLHVYQNGPHGMALGGSDKHVGSWTDTCRLWLERNHFHG